MNIHLSRNERKLPSREITQTLCKGATENAGPENARPENDGPIHRA